MNPGEEEVLLDINTYVVTNGNNEITADVLNPILNNIVEQSNGVTGQLDQLATVTQENLVSAINEVRQIVIDNENSGIQLHEGTENPNTTPPSEYNIADFYIQKDLSNNPVKLWQYNGVSWVGSFQTSDNDYHFDFPYVGSNNFTIPENAKGISVFKNKAFLYKSEYTRTTATNVNIVGTLETDDIISIVGTLL